MKFLGGEGRGGRGQYVFVPSPYVVVLFYILELSKTFPLKISGRKMIDFIR